MILISEIVTAITIPAVITLIIYNNDDHINKNNNTRNINITANSNLYNI